MRGTSLAVALALTASGAMAQTTDTPQRSRDVAPNMPAVQETIPEKVRPPKDPDATGTVPAQTPERDSPQDDSPGPKHG